MRPTSVADENDVNIMGPPVPNTISDKVGPVLRNGKSDPGTGYLVAVGSRTARFRRRHAGKGLIVFLALLILVLIIILIILCCLLFRRPHKHTQVCESRECLRSATNLALSMNPVADPCEDFYQYVCGNWGEDHPKPDTSIAYDWFNDKQKKVYRVVREFLAKNDSIKWPKPVHQAKDMYAACINTDKLDELGFTPIFDMLEAIGLPQYPTILNATAAFDYNSYGFDWIQVVIKIKTLLSMDVIIGFDLIPDPKNGTVNRLIMGSPETINPFPRPNADTDKYLDQIKKERLINLSSKIKKYDYSNFINLDKDSNHDDSDSEKSEEDESTTYYKMYIIEIMKAMFTESDGPKLTQMFDPDIEKNMVEAVSKYLEFETLVYALTEDVDNSTDELDDMFEIDIPQYTIDELQKETDKIVELNNGTSSEIWKRYLTGVFSVSDETFNADEEKILVSGLDMKYLGLMAALLSKSSTALIELYIWLQVVQALILHTTNEMRELHERYSRRLTGVESSVPRSLHCASAVNEMMGMAVSYGITDDDFQNITKPKVNFMLYSLKVALARLVDRSKWMDEITKVATLDKILQMKSFIGFPDWLLEEGKLEEYYDRITIDVDKHLENMIGILQIRIKRGLNKYKFPNNFTWASDPTEVNAFHTFQANAITVPLVMLQYPFYDLGLEALNYGAIGTILGHEITHGFDNIGRQYDKNGNMIQWWTNKTILSFVNETECFVNQYSSFYVPEVDQHVNGKMTLGENIADNGGLREAYDAYQLYRRRFGPEPKLVGFESMTHDQLFFLSYANLWCGVTTKESLKWDLKDEHSPNPFRLKGALQNIPEFAKAWHCPNNCTMNPERKRCAIF